MSAAHLPKFDNTHSPIVRYDFENNLLDSSGNGHDMTMAAGTERYRKGWGNAIGFDGSAGGIPFHSPLAAALRIPGDITVSVLLVLTAVPSNCVLFTHSATGETEATNVLYQAAITNHQTLTWLQESGAGIDAPSSGGVAFSSNVPALPSVGVPFLLTFRRKNGVIRAYLDGLQWGNDSPVLTTPTGGTSGQLVLNSAGTNRPIFLGFEIIDSALTDEEIRGVYNRTKGAAFGELSVAVDPWVGAIQTDGASVVARLSFDTTVRLAVTGPGGTVYSSAVASSGRVARLDISGLSQDTEYSYIVESTIDGTSCPIGKFKTLPAAAGTAADFTVAFSGDTLSGSNHNVFDTIRAFDPLLFLHLGDLHYDNISTNDQALFQAAYDKVLKSSRQARLLRETPTVYVWDDHDYGGNNSDGGSASKLAAAAVYRNRVPHYPLVESTGIYHAFDIGRVRFIVTDQRSAASPDSATDNASKSMLGSAQKAWFLDLLENSPGKLIVWVCPRHFASGTIAGHDSWGGFSTERTEIGSHASIHCPGRIIVLSADVHVLGIDDGSNRSFGGNAFPTFQAAPLDQASNYPGDTFSEGGFGGNGQWGSMEIEDDGTDIDVTWTGYDSAGNVLVTHNFTVTP